MAILPFLLLASLTACGEQPAVTNNQTAGGQAQNTTGPEGDSQVWKSPAGASKTVIALINDWATANEGCQGGINVSADDPICKKRDALQDRLRKHGWCWGAPMDKSAADDAWHRCGTYDTDNLSNLDADIQRGLAALGNENQRNAEPEQHADDWISEKERPKSPLLQAYENAVEPIDQKIALANVLAKCGIRGREWHRQMLTVLDDRKRQPSIDEMQQRLSPSDAAVAKRFDQIVIDGSMKFHLGDQLDTTACSSIANMPFVLNDRAFQR